jgi:histidine triad (HIT) family protein
MTDSIFTKIIKREIPADIVYETETVIAFRDISAKAPTHVLIVPKEPVRNITKASKELAGDLIIAAAEVAKKLGVAENGFRLVINTGAEGGQTVFHLHIHLLAGRQMEWPPG